ncbi:MAG TPA: hypothetical protein VIL61_06515 [Nitrospiria bacterium]
MSVNPAFLFGLYVRGRASFKYAETRGGPGVEFARFGRTIERRLLLKGYPPGLAYPLTPVNIVATILSKLKRSKKTGVAERGLE